MEQELGIALFRRLPGRIELTASGDILLPKAEQVLAVFNALIAMYAKSRVKSGSLSIALFDDAEFLRLGPLPARLACCVPAASITHELLLFRRSDRAGHLRQLRCRILHCRRRPAGAGSVVLCPVSYVVVAPRAQADVLAKASWRGEVAAMPWIASPPRSHVRAIQNRMFANQGVVPNIVIECDQLSAIGEMVRSGLGLAVMREEAAVDLVENGELFIWPHVTTACQLMFVFRASEESNPSTIGMISVLKDCWGI